MANNSNCPFSQMPTLVFSAHIYNIDTVWMFTSLPFYEFQMQRVRPSPERLELQMRSLTTAQETLRDTIDEERNIAAETSKQMIDTVARMLDGKLSQIADHFKPLQKDLSDVKNSVVRFWHI